MSNKDEAPPAVEKPDALKMSDEQYKAHKAEWLKKSKVTTKLPFPPGDAFTVPDYPEFKRKFLRAR